MKRALAVRLTEEETAAKSLELAKLVNKRAEIEQDAKDAAGGFRAKLKPIKKRIAEVAQAVESGTEERAVEVKQVEAMTNGAVEYERVDTGERWVEPLAEKADQPTLPGGKGKKGPAAEAKSGKKKPNGPSSDFSTGEPALGVGADGEDYQLTAEQADEVRNGRMVYVQSVAQGVRVDILKLKKIPKATAAADDGPPPPKAGKGAAASAGAH